MTTGTKAQYAKHKGFSKAYLSKKNIKALLLPAMEKDPATGADVINFEKADALLDAQRDPAQPDRRGHRNPPTTQQELDDGSPKYGDVKTQRESVKLETDRLNLLQRKGETLSRREVIDACAAAGHKFQEHTKSCSHRLAEKLATMSDPREIKTMIDEEFRRMLEIIADDFKRKFDNTGEETANTAH